MTSAIIFDAFGTVIEMKRRSHPYRILLRLGMKQGRRFGPEALRQLMMFNGSIAEAADLLRIRVTAGESKVIQVALHEELESCEPFSDAIEAMVMLKSAGLSIGICSNLAHPYGLTVRRQLPAVDKFAFSYELGVMKPDPVIYQILCRELGVTPGRDWYRGGIASVLMIGDSPRCDRDGPRAVGVSGFLLRRDSPESFENLVQFANAVLAQGRQ
jgi:FMN phosphatase YigB (HAD superfamily)